MANGRQRRPIVHRHTSHMASRQRRRAMQALDFASLQQPGSRASAAAGRAPSGLATPRSDVERSQVLSIVRDLWGTGGTAESKLDGAPPCGPSFASRQRRSETAEDFDVGSGRSASSASSASSSSSSRTSFDDSCSSDSPQTGQGVHESNLQLPCTHVHQVASGALQRSAVSGSEAHPVGDQQPHEVAMDHSEAGGKSADVDASRADHSQYWAFLQGANTPRARELKEDLKGQTLHMNQRASVPRSADEAAAESAQQLSHQQLPGTPRLTSMDHIAIEVVLADQNTHPKQRRLRLQVADLFQPPRRGDERGSALDVSRLIEKVRSFFALPRGAAVRLRVVEADNRHIEKDLFFLHAGTSVAESTLLVKWAAPRRLLLRLDP